MKHRLQTAALMAIMLATLVLSDRAAEAVRQGLELCARSVIPALFPFLVLSGLFSGSFRCSGNSRVLRLAAQLFCCSPQGVCAFFLGILGGYPTGARTAEQLFRQGQISRQEGENLLCFCNNAGPAFILGLVGLGRFDSLHLGIALYLIHVTAAFLSGLLMVRRSIVPSPCCSGSPEQLPFSQLLARSVTSAGITAVHICAYVVSAVTFLQLLSELTAVSHPLLLGAVELTNGIVRLGRQKKDFVISAILLGWGGLCVHGQTAAVTPQLQPNMRRYLSAKLLHGALSGFLACGAAEFFF